MNLYFCIQHEKIRNFVIRFFLSKRTKYAKLLLNYHISLLNFMAQFGSFCNFQKLLLTLCIHEVAQTFLVLSFILIIFLISKNCIYLWYTKWCFDICIHCKMAQSSYFTICGTSHMIFLVRWKHVKSTLSNFLLSNTLF